MTMRDADTVINEWANTTPYRDFTVLPLRDQSSAGRTRGARRWR